MGPEEGEGAGSLGLCAGRLPRARLWAFSCPQLRWAESCPLGVTANRPLGAVENKVRHALACLYSTAVSTRDEGKRQGKNCGPAGPGHQPGGPGQPSTGRAPPLRGRGRGTCRSLCLGLPPLAQLWKRRRLSDTGLLALHAPGHSRWRINSVIVCVCVCDHTRIQAMQTYTKVTFRVINS